MISLFTDPYDDELLYSACARFSEKMKYPNIATAARELFGGKNGIAPIIFPNRLNHLISVITTGHNYTADRFIDDYTPFHFYAPFIPDERLRILREEMKGARENRIYSRLGINANRLNLPTSLRFCPDCVQEDRRKYRQTYWHVIHQLPGIEVCPHHAIFLESSKAGWRGRHNRNAFVSAESVVKTIKGKQLDLVNHHHNILLKLSQDALWLLKWRGDRPSSLALRDRYYNLLLRKGLAYYNGHVRRTKLLKDFVGFYSAKLLKNLQSEIGDQNECWLLRIVRSHKLESVQPPLRHLLLMTFLGHTAEEVFTRYEEYKSFGEGPWPCLNRASDHFGEKVISTCRVTDGEKKNKGKPVGTFRCTCGFMYLRVGPDRDEKDAHRFNKVISYGQVWEYYFKQKWNDPSLTLTELATTLNVIPFTLRRHAIRLKLPSLRPGSYSRPTTEKIIEQYSNTKQTFEEALRSRQERWLIIRKANPKATRRQLLSMDSYTYDWLSRYVPEWLENNMPKPKIFKPPPVRVNWKKWDAVIMKAVKNAAPHILDLSGRPVRVSKEAIIREVGHRSWIEQHLDKLPRTAKALDKYLETTEDFLIRRVKWAEDCFSEEDIYPTRLQLTVRAGTRTKTGSAPRVQSAIDNAIERLRRKFRLN